MTQNETIIREKYLARLRPYIGQPLIKVLTGQRRVGKSRILQMLRAELAALYGPDNILYLDMEDFSNRIYTDKAEFYRLTRTRLPPKGKKTALLVDEIQEITGFEEVLRSLAGENLWDITITGSNARLMSGELATLLTGRYVEINVYSLSFPEFLRFNDRQPDREALEAWWTLGGLPQLTHLPDNREIRQEYLDNILSSVFLKDVVARHQIRHVDLLRRIAEYAADTAGSILSVKKISDFLASQKLKISPSVVSDYLRFMEEAFLVFRVRREDLAGKRLLEIGEKWFFQDLGIKNTLSGFQNRHIPGVLENCVYLHLRHSGYTVTVGAWKDREIDFVARRGDETLYVQAAYLLTDDKVRRREFGNLLGIPDNHRKMVVSLDPVTRPESGVEHLNLVEFLGGYV